MSTYSTIDTVETYAQEEWLQDPDGVEWTAASGRVTRAVNAAHRWLAKEMADVRNSRWFTDYQTFSVAANTETYDLSGFTRSFLAFKSLFLILSDGGRIFLNPLPDGEEERSRLLTGDTVSSDTPPMFFIRMEAGTELLHILPLSSQQRDFGAYVRYEPPTLTTGQPLHTPDRYDDIVAADASRRLLLAEGETDDDLNRFIESRVIDMKEEIAMSSGEAYSRTIKHVARFGL